VKIKELLSDESKWCRGAFAKDKDGFPITESHQDACKWCLAGAGYFCYGIVDWENEVGPRAWAAIRKLTGLEEVSASRWNDDPNTKFEDVRKLIEELDI
jgi:hypothetical protein